MALPAPIPGGSGPDRINGVQPSSQAEKRSNSAVDGVAFRALLDKLEVQAQELKTQASGVERSDELAGAVGNAAESLEQALSLSDQLVEAFRQSVQQEPKSDSSNRPRESDENAQ